jgi:hypothetical protein
MWRPAAERRRAGLTGGGVTSASANICFESLRYPLRDHELVCELGFAPL